LAGSVIEPDEGGTMTQPTSRERFKPTPKMVAGAIIGVLALVFILQNTGRIRVHLLFFHIDNPAWVWLLVLFAAGFVLGSIFPWFRRRAKRDTGSSPAAE
jgi:uncharacterized integral membrane protein